MYRGPGTSLSEFQNYWQDQHAGVVTSIAMVKENLPSHQQVRGACMRNSRSIASRGLTSCPLFLQAHVNEEVSTLHPDPL